VRGWLVGLVDAEQKLLHVGSSIAPSAFQIIDGASRSHPLHT
jgi:hypothetical protein